MTLINAPSQRGNLSIKSMNQIQSEILIKLLLIGEDPPVPIFNNDQLNRELEGAGFLQNIVQKRIDVLNLPVRFTLHAHLALDAFTDRAGGAVLLLIDTLEYLSKEGDISLVTLDDLISLYPSGFYDMDKISDWIDTRVKRNNPDRIRWAEVYE